MENQNFVSQLLSSENPRWVIVLCNILDGLDAKLYDEDFVREAIGGWCAEFLNLQGKSTQLDRLLDITLAKPELRLKCAVSDTADTMVGSYAHAMCEEVFLNYILHEEDRSALGGDARVNLGARRLAGHTVIPNVHIKRGSGVGKHNGVVFLTHFTGVAPLLKGNTKADDVRDRLGLVHWEENKEYIVLELDAKDLSELRLSRPTFVDAGGHRRFKAVANDPANHTRDWGLTLDLDGFAKEDGSAAVDGLPERACERIAADKISTINAYPLGSIKIVRGKSSTDDDKKYAKFLLKPRKEADIETLIKAIL